MDVHMKIYEFITLNVSKTQTIIWTYVLFLPMRLTIHGAHQRKWYLKLIS